MRQPSLDQLNEVVDNKYALVVAVARRARQLADGATPLVDGLETSKPVTLALEEIAKGLIICEAPKDGVK